jgi:all-trans-retinol 13,14-reductase
MHGVLGVTISAIMTCAQLVGLDHLIEKIKDAQKVS